MNNSGSRQGQHLLVVTRSACPEGVLGHCTKEGANDFQQILVWICNAEISQYFIIENYLLTSNLLSRFAVVLYKCRSKHQLKLMLFVLL